MAALWELVYVIHLLAQVAAVMCLWQMASAAVPAVQLTALWELVSAVALVVLQRLVVVVMLLSQGSARAGGPEFHCVTETLVTLTPSAVSYITLYIYIYMYVHITYIHKK